MSSSPDDVAQAEAPSSGATPLLQQAGCILPPVIGTRMQRGPEALEIRLSGAPERGEIPAGGEVSGLGGAITAGVASGYRMPSGGGDQPVRHWGRGFMGS